MAHAVNRAETPLCNGSTLSIMPWQRGEDAMTPLVSRAVRKARAGDRDALRFLYARYADDVYGYARTIVPDNREARDVTRRAFARLERLIGSYDEGDVSFGVWIQRLARSVAADEFRQRY